MFVEVAIPVHIHQTFTYLLPDRFQPTPSTGCRVLVPFGSQLVTGYIVALTSSAAVPTEETDYEMKEVVQVFDLEPIVAPEILELTKWIADYYFAPWGEVIKGSLPNGINTDAEIVLTITAAGRESLERTAPRQHLSSRMKALTLLAQAGQLNLRDLARDSSRTRALAIARELERAGLISMSRELQPAVVRPKQQQAVRLTTPAPQSNGKPLTDRQQRTLDVLSTFSEAPASRELLELASVGPSVLGALERRGFIEVFSREVRRNPLAHLADYQGDELSLNAEQQAALDEMTSAIELERYAAFLLHGVTGSGKTEVYMRAMRAAVDRGKGALMLVPEIALTPVFSRRLRVHFGDDIAILHSALSDGERLDEWNRLRRGEARVCIGARSAVFAPIDNLGVIVVDEEHEASYKQDESPRYNARDAAIWRASRANAVVILGSATPSMESFQNARAGKYHYLKLSERIGGKDLARVEMIDMREVFTRHGKQQLFSDEMKEAIALNFERGEQTMVLLNRRGFSSYVLCRGCGCSVQCPLCDVTLTYHKTDARLMCHYCGHMDPVPKVCPLCSGKYIYFIGEGTEQIEARLKEMHPEMRVARMDRDAMRKRGAFERVLGSFAAGEIDLLVGTQMIAKGHDFHNVTLVCVISVDSGMAMPDFRSAERTFQLLTQVSGRAGRGDKPGRVLIQSYHPEHYALEFARTQVYEQFFEHEIHFRHEMRYPPFVALINLLVRHREYKVAAAAASELARLLTGYDAAGSLRVLGPASAPIARLKGEHRMQILLKTNKRQIAREALDHALRELRSGGFDQRRISIDVDPVNLM